MSEPEKVNPPAKARVAAAGVGAFIETNSWGRHGRVDIQTSHTLSQPLGHLTIEHHDGETVEPPPADDQREFAIPASVVHVRPAQRLPEDSLCRSPIAGLVVDVAASAGQAVKKGQMVLIVEAMKMQNHIGPEVDGVLKAMHVQPGDAVKAGQVLFEIL
jgi:biotin carboxyl carrier protein